MSTKKNMGQILEAWSPIVEKITEGAVSRKANPEKMSWICEMAHNTKMAKLNEAAEAGGVSFPYNNLYNTMGIGNPTPAQRSGQTAADQSSRETNGSGDKWPALLPMALQVAARTVGFDLVNTTPFDGPTGVIPFADYVYSNGKNPYGATPSYDSDSANPDYAVGGVSADKAWKNYSNPSCFRTKMTLDASAGTLTRLAIGDKLTAKGQFDLSTGFKVEFIAMSRLTAEPMFKVVSATANLGTIFDVENGVTVDLGDGAGTILLTYPRLVSMLEDQIQGFVGAGKYDSDKWTGTFQNPYVLYEPMDRATGEQQYPRQLSMTVHTKMVNVGTISVAIAVTQEQIQDLQKQWGIDVLKMVENNAINELSQSINKHILSRLFALGWLNHTQAYQSEGVNLNLNMTSIAMTDGTPAFVTYFDGAQSNVSMPCPAAADYGDFENLDTKFARVAKLIKTAGNIVMQRGRRGPGNFVVTNYRIASMLQDSAQYSFAPMANTFNQENGNLYPLGNLAGMTVYVDATMRFDDTRVLVGRKGAKDEPGVHFCPYIMAESIRLISEGTGAPKVIVKSRYALVDVGWHPQTQYFTLFINLPENMY